MSWPSAEVLFSACLFPFLVSELPTQIGNAVGVPDPARRNESRVGKLQFQIQQGLDRRREIIQKNPTEEINYSRYLDR